MKRLYTPSRKRVITEGKFLLCIMRMDGISETDMCDRIGISERELASVMTGTCIDPLVIQLVTRYLSTPRNPEFIHLDRKQRNRSRSGSLTT